MMRNVYYIVEKMDEDSMRIAESIHATAIIVGIPESLIEISQIESWTLPHVWIEEVPELNMGPEDVT
jgi:hypothetical protein